MRHVQTNAELAAIHSAGAGLIFNDFTSGPTAAENNRLHLAGCPWVKRMLAHCDPASAPPVRKVFFGTFDEARSWLAGNRGWKPCPKCRPDETAFSGVIGDSQPRAARRRDPYIVTADQADDVFREVEVERLLYAHLRNAGYAVQEKVPVTSGIVDAVATRDGERVVIEVKGEDSGGYGSAQMNLQMVVGQISSRMDDLGATYAIAFPMTANYLKVLRTFRGSPAFERLNLVCYLVPRDGQVRRIEAREVRGWIDSLAL
jgi:hypothetical protein